MLTLNPNLMAQLAQVVKQGIRTLEPHAGDRGPGPFGGTFDWHSCVHAHWMLLSMERFGAPADPWLHNRLSGEILQREFDFLAAHPNFEMPYGRVWLLLLLAEMGKQGQADQGIQDLSQQLQQELLDYLQTHPFPEYPDRPYPYLGTHYSWLFTHWMATLAAQLNGADSGELEALWHSRIQPQLAPLRRHDPVPNDFLDLDVMADLAVLLREKTPPLATRLTDIPPSIGAHNAHLAARLFQELWARAIWSPDSVQDLFNDLLAREYLWKFNFEHASHFVPQFAWMAVYLSEGWS
ncbi:MAG: DUF2891 family protein [Candidatus Latescibacteria bacterium]|nr:DUF2891 family protein [Candidatus Latescibacterota bacterium]